MCMSQPCQLTESEGSILSLPLKGLDWVTGGSSTRKIIPPTCSSAEAALIMRKALNLENLPLIFCRQRHTDRIHVVRERTELFAGDTAGHSVIDSCDGLISPVAGVALAVFTADCVPIVFVEEKHRIVGVVHAGWRGTFAEIAIRALESIGAVGGDTRYLRVWFGPAIGGCCYEVGEDLAGSFANKFRHLIGLDGAFLSGRFLDLVQLNKLQLVYAGVPISHIQTSGFCTKDSVDLFYSFRAEGERAGRIVTLVARTK